MEGQKVEILYKRKRIYLQVLNLTFSQKKAPAQGGDKKNGRTFRINLAIYSKHPTIEHFTMKSGVVNIPI